MLINAEAIGVNFIDTYFRTGLYAHRVPFTPGSEVCGVAAAVGERVSRTDVGDRVATSVLTPNNVWRWRVWWPKFPTGSRRMWPHPHS
ncbi:hypothetical protein A5627_22295 [Mycobacterium colombiense]|nr:hypothetical protein A5627_22295 [Mycobacterium colombiense]